MPAMPSIPACIFPGCRAWDPESYSYQTRIYFRSQYLALIPETLHRVMASIAGPLFEFKLLVRYELTSKAKKPAEVSKVGVIIHPSSMVAV